MTSPIVVNLAQVQSFNLVDDHWIPLEDGRKVSLLDVFSSNSVSLGGNPVQKVAIIKLLLAIAMSAYLPEHDDDWQDLGPNGLAQKVRYYLHRHRDKFSLSTQGGSSGPTPFLQVPAIVRAKVAPWAELNPQYAAGNTTVLTQSQRARTPTLADVAMTLVVLSSCALGGKKTDNSVVLTPGYQGKTKSGGAGPAMAFKGLLHSFLWSTSLVETVWLNLLTRQDIAVLPQFPHSLGVAPWEDMPQGEDDPVAQRLRGSIMGRLVPMNRFCLIAEGGEGLHYSEGVIHPSYLDGVSDPSVAIKADTKKNKVLWVNPEKTPWRELPSLLSLLSAQKTQDFRIFGLECALRRASQQSRVGSFAVWSGGLSVSSQAGEQYITAADDYVESRVWIEPSLLNQIWFVAFKDQLEEVDKLSKTLYSAVLRYNEGLSKQAPDQAAAATREFWQLVDPYAQELVESADYLNVPEGALRLSRLRTEFASAVEKVYDRACPNVSARQMEAWVRARPNLSSYRAATAKLLPESQAFTPSTYTHQELS